MKPTRRDKSHDINPRHQDWTLRRARGETCADIAREQGVDASTVAKATRRAERILAARFARSIQGQKMRMTHTLEQVIAKAFAQFEQSCQAELTTVETTTPQGAAQSRKLKAQFGNPAFLQAITAAVAKISDLWGINGDSHKPDEVEGFRWAGATEAQLVDEEIRKLTLERSRMRIDA